MNAISIRTCAIIILLASMAGMGNAASLGVSVANPESPGEYDMFFRNMVRDGYSERIITIGSSTGTEPLDVHVLVDDAFKDWFTFDPGTNFTIYPNVQFALKVTVRPPEDVQNGIYTGLVTVRASPSASGENGSSMSVTAAVALKTAVEITGDQIVDWRVKNIKVSDTEEGLPIKASVTIENRGNVRAVPKIVVDILNQNKDTMLKSSTFSDFEVMPSVTKTLDLSVPSDSLSTGQYWAGIKVYDGDNLTSEKVLTFDVLEKGALRITGELVQVWCPTRIDLGSIAKINAVFINTGEMITSAKFSGEVNLDGTLVDIIGSDEIDVPVGAEVNITVYYKPKDGGRYTIGGHVLYSKKITDVKECILNVFPEGGSPTGAFAGLGGIGFDYVAIFAVAVIAVAAVLVFSIAKRRMSKKAIGAKIQRPAKR